MARIAHENTDVSTSREAWVHYHADLVYKLWLRQDTYLGIGIAPDYAHQIEADLAAFYEHPLKRTFIENTYQSDTAAT